MKKNYLSLSNCTQVLAIIVLFLFQTNSIEAQTMTFDSGPSHSGFSFSGWKKGDGGIIYPSQPNANGVAKITKNNLCWNLVSFTTKKFGNGGGYRVTNNKGQSYSFYPNNQPSKVHTLNWMKIKWVKIVLFDLSTYGVNFTYDFDDVVYTIPGNTPASTPGVTENPNPTCPGSNTTLTISGNLNDATKWFVYSTASGAGLVGSTSGTTLIVNPNSNTTYYVRGEDEGGCVVNGGFGSVNVTVKILSTAFTSVTNDLDLICSGQLSNLTAIGGVNGTGAVTKWYSGPDGTGTLLGTGSGLAVSPTISTTYFVRREGDCNTTLDASVTLAIIPANENDDDGDGFSECEGDCDDSDPTIYPGAPELCDGLDNNCDGDVPVSEIDDDGDGFSECEGDCDDSDPTVYPSAPELCDGLDNDCDGVVPNNERDNDADGFSECQGDCDDSDPTRYPGAPELPCDGIDNNCDTNIDENRGDLDGDGFDECVDCDDSDPTVYPGAPELCDGLDNDCDGVVPANEIDNDRDGFSECQGDCDDTDSSIYPGAPEICDGLDNDCDGFIDTDDDSLTDAENPTALCKNITVELDANGLATITAAQIDNGSTDNCGIQSLSLSKTDFTCAEVGANTVTLTVTDVNGNQSTCEATVTVVDNIPPEIICQDVTIYLDANGEVQFNPLVDGAVVSRSDNCATKGFVGFTGPKFYYCNQIGTHSIRIFQQDVNGNQSYCDMTLTVKDIIPPTALCKTGVVAYLDANGNASITAAEIDNGSTDNCGIASISVSPNTFNCAQEGATIEVTLTVTDNNDNVSTCTTTVEVDDKILPDAVGKNIIVQLDANGNASISPNDVNGGSSDNCGWTRALSVTPSTFDCTNIGANTVTLKVGDGNGNQNTCTATVTVQDNIPPTALTQDVIVELNANGNGSTTAEAVNNGSNDNCDIASLVLSKTDFDCNAIGNNTVILTVTDVNGNISQETANVDVQDNVSPIVLTNDIIVVLDANGNGSTTVAAVNNGVSDNCGIASVVLSKSDFDCDDVGNNIVTLTVTDVNGNVTNGTANVDVQDNIGPELTGPFHVTGFINSNCEFIVPDYTNLTIATDNCNTVTVTQSPIAGTIITDFTYSISVILTANDGNGNTATVAVTGGYALDAAGARLWYIDADGDGYGDASYAIWGCTQPDGYASNDRDCDDTNPNINPRKAEILNNDIDENCDGKIERLTLSNSTFNFDNLKITPNPFNNSLKIDLSTSITGDFKISLFDLNGRLVFSKNTSSVNGRINVDGLEKLASAVYFLKIVDNASYEYTVKRLIKE